MEKISWFESHVFGWNSIESGPRGWGRSRDPRPNALGVPGRLPPAQTMRPPPTRRTHPLNASPGQASRPRAAEICCRPPPSCRPFDGSGGRHPPRPGSAVGRRSAALKGARAPPHGRAGPAGAGPCSPPLRRGGGRIRRRPPPIGVLPGRGIVPSVARPPPPTVRALLFRRRHLRWSGVPAGLGP